MSQQAVCTELHTGLSVEPARVLGRTAAMQSTEAAFNADANNYATMTAMSGGEAVAAAAAAAEFAETAPAEALPVDAAAEVRPATCVRTHA